MRLDISIREKLVVYYVSLGILSIVLVGIYSFSSARQAIIERSFNQLTSVREVKKERLQRFFQDRNRDINLLSNSKVIFDLQDFFKKKQTIYFNSILESESYLRDFFKSGNYYSYMTITNTDNSYIEFSITKKQEGSSVKKLQGSIYEDLTTKISNFKTFVIEDYIFIDSTHTILIGSPILDENFNLIGTIILGIPENAINEIMVEDNSLKGLGESGESYLVGNDFLMRSKSRFQDNSINKTEVKTAGVINALNNNAGTEVIQDYRNIAVLSSYCKLNVIGLNWVILAEINFKEVMTPIYKIRNDIILISSFISITLFFISFFISKRITDPLIKLNKFTMDIAYGKYGRKLPVETNDEIGELTESFNTMSVQIKEQTKELVEREKRLKHFYEATKDGIILHARGIPVLVNQAIAELTNYTTNELMKLQIGDIFSISDPELYKQHPNKSFSYETVCFRKDGSHFPIEVQENPIEYEGEIISSSVIRNIKERVDAQLAIKKERQKRLTSFFDGQENERKRLSRELHDGLGQVLIGIKMRLESLKFRNPEQDLETVTFLKDIANQTIKEVRRMSNDLMPSVLRELGLLMAINQLCKQVQQNLNILVSFEHQNVTTFEDDRIKTYVYRVIQEAINNAVKHGKATEIRIILIYEALFLQLIIEDNGIGFDMNNINVEGNGLYNMRERIHILDGNINISSNPGEGTIINAKLPVNNKDNEKN